MQIRNVYDGRFHKLSLFPKYTKQQINNIKFSLISMIELRYRMLISCLARKRSPFKYAYKLFFYLTK